MNILLICIILLLLACTSWGITYHFKHTRLHVENLGSAGVIEPESLNGIGSGLLGGFRSDYPGYRIYYLMYTVYFLPIYPIKCVIGEYVGSKDGRTQFEIIGRTHSKAIEILSIFALRWGLFFIIVPLIGFIFYNVF